MNARSRWSPAGSLPTSFGATRRPRRCGRRGRVYACPYALSRVLCALALFATVMGQPLGADASEVLVLSDHTIFADVHRAGSVRARLPHQATLDLALDAEGLPNALEVSASVALGNVYAGLVIRQSEGGFVAVALRGPLDSFGAPVLGGIGYGTPDIREQGLTTRQPARCTVCTVPPGDYTIDVVLFSGWEVQDDGGASSRVVAPGEHESVSISLTLQGLASATTYAPPPSDPSIFGYAAGASVSHDVSSLQGAYRSYRRHYATTAQPQRGILVDQYAVDLRSTSSQVLVQFEVGREAGGDVVGSRSTFTDVALVQRPYRRTTSDVVVGLIQPGDPVGVWSDWTARELDFGGRHTLQADEARAWVWLPVGAGF